MTNPGVYCVTSTMSVGCTFLDWSILWLSGQREVFSNKSLSCHAISQNPLQYQKVANAHGHIKNHPSGMHESQQCIQDISRNHTVGLASLYPYPLHLDVCCDNLAMQVQDLENPANLQKLWAYQEQDYVDMLNWIVCEQKIPVIYVGFDASVRGYLWSERSSGRMLTRDKFHDVFFGQSQECWRRLGLTETWDIRERMALDTRPFSCEWTHHWVPAHDHFYVNCQDLWFDTERTVQHIMIWLDLEIVPSRLDHWLPIMRRWQQVHNDTLRFPRQLPRLLSSIINGYDHAVPDLTLDQEAIIQHCLIYQYGMNLKNWNLEKFPNSTANLHALLEPNTHPLSDH